MAHWNNTDEIEKANTSREYHGFESHICII